MLSRYNLANKGTVGAGQVSVSNRDNCLALTVITKAIDVCIAVPILLPAGRISSFNFEVTTGGGAGNKTRVGLFSNKRADFLYPDKLLSESAEIDSTATGIKATSVTLDVDEGLYWFGLVNGAGTLAEYRAVAVAGLPALLGENATPVAVTGLTKAMTYNANGFAANMLTNSTFPTGAATSILIQPLFWVTYSK